MNEKGLKDITNGSAEPYQSRTRSAMAEVRRNNHSLRNSLQAIQQGMGLLQGQIAERKRAREERAAEAAQSSDQKHLKFEKISDVPALSPK